MDALITALEKFGAWIRDLLLWVPRKVFAEMMDGLATVVETIPVPSAVSVFQNEAVLAFAGTGYVVDIFALDVGVTLVASALLSRFILRRIPFIG